MEMEKITKEGKARFFSLVSYLTTNQLTEIMQRKGVSVRAWAMIDHDKDIKDAHRHLVMRTNSSWKPSQVLKWFIGTDEAGKDCNTFIEVVHDRTAICEYLTHENDPDKYHYDHSEVIDHGLCDLLPSSESADDTFEIVEKMTQGVSVRELVRLYGRDFVYHYGNYVAVFNAIREEEML